MYESYYGLSRLPFENVLDTSFYYPSYGHREALSAVLYAINQKKGLVVVAGHPGTGKSFLMQLVKEQLLETDYVIEIKSRMDLVKGLIERLEDVLAIEPGEEFSQYRQDKLTQQLEKLGEKGARIILLIDEAQTLNEEEMEYIRLLWNIESASGKLIQTVLFGQKELLDHLRMKEMQATLQRVQVFRVLKGLDIEETRRYVKKRLNASGCDEMVFTEDGLKLIHGLSRGHLRMINQLCDQGMMSAYVAEKAFVDVDQIRDVVAENPIFMDDYEREIDVINQSKRAEEKVTSKPVITRIERTADNEQVQKEEEKQEDKWEEEGPGVEKQVNTRRIELGSKLPETTRDEVVAKQVKGYQQRLLGMVMGAVLIGIVWLVVSSSERQAVIEAAVPPVNKADPAQEPQNVPVTEDGEEAGPLFVIDDLEARTSEKQNDDATEEIIEDNDALTSHEASVQEAATQESYDSSPPVQEQEKLSSIAERQTTAFEEPGAAIVKIAVAQEPTQLDVKTTVLENEGKLDEVEQQQSIQKPGKTNIQIAETDGAANNSQASTEQVEILQKAEDTAQLQAPGQQDVQPEKELKDDEADNESESVSLAQASPAQQKLMGINQDIPFPFGSIAQIETEKVEIKEGASVSRLALQRYGAWNWTLEDILTQLNPEIQSMDMIVVDSSIEFPLFKRDYMLIKSDNGKYYIYLKTVDIEKVRSERERYTKEGAAIRLQEVILRGNRKIRLYIGPMSDKSLAQDWLHMVTYDFAPSAMK